ncbi:iron-sulfur cluster assembly scaffold protein [Gemmiger formicilis]|uniref:iron-sulfur cluster assembly scaffold protein n=1 Tax=Gemmiger formicilis TaxID=745368 RepID=UPI00195DE296|nr:iron-sulfur cluster assembly scaffold protein [Gemmiger formicilis]MBM6914954.1 iron-sulfur cluster assembly scaffold protein [Gemmiger formicilis]
MATDRQKVLKLAADTQYNHLPPQANGVGFAQEPHCGDLLRIGLEVNPRQVVVNAGFTITESACPPAVASAVAAVKLALNKPVLAAYTVDLNAIAEQMSDGSGLDKEHVHCAQMAELALKRAVLDYASKRTAPPVSSN